MEVAVEDDIKPECKLPRSLTNLDRTEPEEKTVVQVVRGFKSGTHTSQIKYKQICQALAQLDRWSEAQRSEFLLPFFDLAQAIDPTCHDLVKALCDVHWTLVPAELQPGFIEMLRDICALNPGFVDVVIRCCVKHLFPLTKFEMVDGKNKAVTVLEESVQEEIYQKSVQCIYDIVNRLAPAVFSLSSAILKQKPHHTAPVECLVSHVRNTIVLAEQFPQISDELYGCLINSLLLMDGVVSQYSGAAMVQDASNIFPRSGHTPQLDHQTNKDIEHKLDMCLKVLLCYVSLGQEDAPIRPDDSPHTKWMSSVDPPRNMFGQLLPLFETHMLYVHEMDNVPFLWFAMCARSRENLLKMLRTLWRAVITPTQRPNEFKKTHNAAAFMGGLLARASFVNFPLMSFWLRQMVNWCVRYMERAGQVKRPGGHQHGTFYAVFQAIVFVLCYRYKEFVDQNQASDVRVWGIGRLVHCQLEPLSYIARPLAHCFASVSRYMQVVYCSHMIGLTEYTPLECYFPFMGSGLEQLSYVIKPMLRPFDPVDDFDMVHNVAPRLRQESHTEEVGEFDFMQVDEGVDMNMDYQTAMTC